MGTILSRPKSKDEAPEPGQMCYLQGCSSTTTCFHPENISNQTRANKLAAFGGGLPAGYSHRVYANNRGLARFARTSRRTSALLLVSGREFPRCLNSSGVRRHAGCLQPCFSNDHGGRGHQETLLTLAKPTPAGRAGR